MKRNILLVILDGCRTDRLGAYGHRDPAASPSIDRLAEHGFVALNHYSTSYCTLPAVTSMMTGLYPCQHGASNTWTYYDGRSPFLTQRLQQGGYYTFGIMNHLVSMSPEFGMLRGYDRFYRIGKEHNWFKASQEERRAIRSATLIARARRRALRTLKQVAPAAARRAECAYHRAFYAAHDMGSARAAEVLGQALNERDPDKPFFGYVNLPDTHHPYIPLERFRQGLRMTDPLTILNMNPSLFDELGMSLTPDEQRTLQLMYDARLRYVDELVARLVGLLQAAKVFEETALILTGDHGGMLYEKRRYLGSTCFTYQPEIHTPLIIHGGAGVKRFEPLSSAIDLFPTILDLADLGVSNGAGPARSLLSGHAGHQEVLIDYPEYPEWLKARHRQYPLTICKYGRLTNRTMVTRERQKVIWLNSGEHEQYDLQRDPSEQHNLFGQSESGWALVEQMTRKYIELLGPAGRYLERYPHNDIGDNMGRLPPIDRINPGFSWETVRNV
jgi:arylsulfatase A-like enzyme